jgi:hypothetical protein
VPAIFGARARRKRAFARPTDRFEGLPITRLRAALFVCMMYKQMDPWHPGAVD